MDQGNLLLISKLSLVKLSIDFTDQNILDVCFLPRPMPNMFANNFILAFAKMVNSEGHPPRASSESMFFLYRKHICKELFYF